jgi:hypothetical protein
LIRFEVRLRQRRFVAPGKRGVPTQNIHQSNDRLPLLKMHRAVEWGELFSHFNIQALLSRQDIESARTKKNVWMLFF